jgi:hypothetical protein
MIVCGTFLAQASGPPRQAADSLRFRVVNVSVRHGAVEGTGLIRNVGKMAIRLYRPIDGVTVNGLWTYPLGQSPWPPKIQINLNYSNAPDFRPVLMPGGELKFPVSAKFPGTGPKTTFVSTLTFLYDTTYAREVYEDLRWLEFLPEAVSVRSNRFRVAIVGNVLKRVVNPRQ